MNANRRRLNPSNTRNGKRPHTEPAPFDVDDHSAVVKQQRSDKAVRKQLSKGTIASVSSQDDLLKHFNIHAADWDYLIVGDGSGTVWDKAIGWGAVLISKHTNDRMPFYGGLSNGTNNVAELMTVLHPLMYLANNTNWADRPHGMKVHVVSDSEYVIKGLEHDNPIWVSGLTLNRELWMAIHMTRRRGIDIRGHHINRDTLDLNRFGHELANAARKRQLGVLTEITRTAQESNPVASQGE